MLLVSYVYNIWRLLKELLVFTGNPLLFGQFIGQGRTSLMVVWIARKLINYFALPILTNQKSFGKFIT